MIAWNKFIKETLNDQPILKKEWRPTLGGQHIFKPNDWSQTNWLKLPLKPWSKLIEVTIDILKQIEWSYHWSFEKKWSNIQPAHHNCRWMLLYNHFVLNIKILQQKVHHDQSEIIEKKKCLRADGMAWPWSRRAYVWLRPSTQWLSLPSRTDIEVDHRGRTTMCHHWHFKDKGTKEVGYRRWFRMHQV